MRRKLKQRFISLSRAGRVVVVSATAIALTAVVGVAGQTIACNNSPTTYTNSFQTVAMSFDTIPTNDSSLNVGESKVTKPGIDGEKKITWRTGTHCNKQVSQKAIKEVVLKQPVSEESQIGTREISTETEDVAIPFGNQDEPDSSMDKGTRKIVQAGANGSKKVTYEVVKIEGNEQSRSAKSEAVTIQPTTQITHYGTKVAQVTQGTNCDPNYTPCIPYYAGNALNCPDVGVRVYVVGTDHYRLDADGDGVGCESY